MRFLSSGLLLGGLIFGPVGCDRPEDPADQRTQEEKTDEAARKAGAQQAVEKLKKAGHEVRAGWEDAKHQNADQDAAHPKE